MGKFFHMMAKFFEHAPDLRRIRGRQARFSYFWSSKRRAGNGQHAADRPLKTARGMEVSVGGKRQ